METKTHSQQFLRKRKFFLFLPLLVLPFTTLLFWALGGGKGSDAQAGQMAVKGGLNMQLPDAYLKDDKSLTKLSYYEKAASDSQKLEEQLKNDPYYLRHKGIETEGLHQTNDTGMSSMRYKQNDFSETGRFNTSPYSNSTYSDPNEAKVYRKLDALNAVMNGATMQSKRTKDYTDVGRNSTTSMNSADVDRLEQMMNMTKNGDAGEDPEMKQLNGMMEKILDIQHPERVKEKIKQMPDAGKGQVFAVRANSNSDNISTLVNNQQVGAGDTFRNNGLSANGFFSLEVDIEGSVEQANAIGAVIHETGAVVDGATVKLRLLADVSVNGTLIPKGSFVFGTASLNGERLNISINSICYKSSLFPVQLAVVDMDGMEGVYIPGAITRDVAKISADRAIQNIGISTLDPSIGAQAASAGIEAAKTLLSKKAKLVKVTLKAGYQVLLRDEKQKTSL